MRRPTTWTAVILGATLLVGAAAPIAPVGTGLALVGTGHPAVIGAPRPTLSQGSRGQAVRELQQLLGVRVDGQFGLGTLRAVLALQTARGLAADGIVGARTWAALDAGAASANSGGRPNLRRGASGPAVAELQRLLTASGHRLAADGRFGPATHEAVVAFQRSRGLAVDGVVGPVTWRALGARGSATPLLISSSQREPWRTFGARKHAVRQGETLASIATATGSTPAALAAANRISQGSRLPVGSTLMVPGTWRCPAPGAGFINDYGFARVGHLHQGNDLFGVRGTPVVAPVSGRVEQRTGGLGGNAVNLYGSDGNRYYFAHLDGYGAKGDVRAGTAIGTIGNTGNAITTLPHLHFEIHPGGGAAVNPYPTLTLACRR